MSACVLTDTAPADLLQHDAFAAPLSSSPISRAVCLPLPRLPSLDDVCCTKRRRTERQQSVLDKVPLEIIERILSFCSLYDRARLRRASKALNALVDQPALYGVVNVHPMPPDGLVKMVSSKLSATHDFTSTSSSCSLLNALLPRLGANLRSLDLSFSCVQDNMLFDMGTNLARLQELRLRGCRGIRDMASIAELMPELRILDLSWSGISTLPDADDCLPRLKHVTLSCAPLVSQATVVAFIASVSSTIETIDLSHLGLSLEYLRVIFSLFATSQRHSPAKPCHMIDLRGIDLLTRSDVRTLREMVGPAIEVRSNAVLESDEIDDIRKFVGLWTGLLDRKQAELRDAARSFAS